MNDSQYRRWWELHLRTCRNEPLSDAERSAYESGLQELHNEEEVGDDLSSLQEVREAVATLDAKCDELLERRGELKAEVARLEAGLSDEERRRLGIRGASTTRTSTNKHENDLHCVAVTVKSRKLMSVIR